jgi:hypothetical protein
LASSSLSSPSPSSELSSSAHGMSIIKMPGSS